MSKAKCIQGLLWSRSKLEHFPCTISLDPRRSSVGCLFYHPYITEEREGTLERLRSLHQGYSAGKWQSIGIQVFPTPEPSFFHLVARQSDSLSF